MHPLDIPSPPLLTPMQFEQVICLVWSGPNFGTPKSDQKESDVFQFYINSYHVFAGSFKLAPI